MIDFTTPPPDADAGDPDASGDPPAEVDVESIEERIDRVADAVAILPPGTPDMQYSITADLPVSLVEALVKHAPVVERATGASIDFDPATDQSSASRYSGTMSLVGPLLRVYAAHVLMVKRLKELEREGPAAPPGRQAERRPRSRRKQGQPQPVQWKNSTWKPWRPTQLQEEEQQKQRQDQRPQRSQQPRQPASRPPAAAGSGQQGGLSKEALKAQIDALQAQLAQVASQVGCKGSGKGKSHSRG